MTILNLNYNFTTVTMESLDQLKQQTNLNKVFQQILVFYGEYDGQKVIRRPIHFMLCRIGFWFLILNTFKYFVLLIANQESVIPFFVGDFLNLETGKTHVYPVAATLNSLLWTCFSLNIFQRLNSRAGNSYWLVFLPFDLEKLSFSVQNVKLYENRSKIAGMRSKEFHLFQQRYLQYAKWIVGLMQTLSLLLAITAISIYIYPFYSRFKDCYYFWPVFVANSLPIYFFLYLVYFLTIGMPLNFSYLTLLQKTRFQNVHKSLSLLAQQKNPKQSEVLFNVHKFVV